MILGRTRAWFGARRYRVVVAFSAVLLVLALLAGIGAAIPLSQTATPDFFSRYHLLNRRYVNLEQSKHAEIGCRTCHETSPLRNAAELVTDYYRSLYKDEEELPKYFTFEPPTNEACLRCHEGDWTGEDGQPLRIPHPAHTRVAAETRSCVGCHKWTGHFETFLEKHEDMPFSGVCAAYECHVGTKQREECTDCHHVLELTAAEWKAGHAEVAKTSGQNICLESCHKIDQCQTCHTTGKTPEFTGPKFQVALETEKLHIRKDWVGPNHGAQALKNRTQCLLCHQSEGECKECHRYRPAFHGEPTAWVGRHSKVTKDVKDPRCIECHEVKWCEECHDQFQEME